MLSLNAPILTLTGEDCRATNEAVESAKLFEIVNESVKITQTGDCSLKRQDTQSNPPIEQSRNSPSEKLVDRRAFLGGLSAAFVAGSSHRLAAQCVPLAPGVSGCRKGLSSHFQIVTQDCPERCWAASIAGIFKYHDHPIDQDVIAQTVFKSLACRPSGNTTVLDAVLNHEWTDDNGDKFTARISGLYDPLNGVAEMDNDDIVSEMKNDRPVLYCNRSHAMVIVGLDYRKGLGGTTIAIDQVHVADPFPGLGFHVLSPAEMVPMGIGGLLTYVASVEIDD